MDGRTLNSKPSSRFPFIGVFIALVVFVVLTGFVGRKVFGELEKLKSARTDNVEWALSQSEVEYLRFLDALSNSDIGDPAEAAERIRLRFDLLYSRIDLFQHGQLFLPFRDVSSASATLPLIRNTLDGFIPYMDGSDAVLLRAVPQIKLQTQSLQNDLRVLALGGVEFFASQSDNRRGEVYSTLAHLINLTGAMLLVMGGLSVGLFHLNIQRRRQGAQLVEINSRLQGILETSLDGVIVANNRGEILTLNPAAEHIFGFRANDVQGVPIGDLIVPDHLRQAHRDGVARMQAGGERRVIGKGRVQVEACRHDGEVFPIEMALSSIREDGDEIFVAFLRDISQAKADEKELIKARDQALAGEKAKTDFLAVMSHEIRTPLNGILGTLQLMFREDINARQRKMLQNMDISGQLLLRHVNAILDIVSTEGGADKTRKEPLNPGRLIQNIIDAQSGAAAERGNAIEWSWTGDAQDWILSDEHKLEQILLNLVGNAIKFTRDGLVKLDARLEDHAGGSTLTISVQDTGIGIAKDQLDKVFDDFQTFDASLDRSAPGTGLGLGIAQRFARVLGGTIEVQSAVGVGSRFDVILPVTRTQAPIAKSQPEETARGMLPALDILVVDDNQINLDVMAAMLEHEGHHVTCRDNGHDAITTAAQRMFDVILMDISMPEMDGLAATRRIRETGCSATVPIYAVSANVFPEDTRTYLEAGMTGVLGKPLTFAALESALLNIVDPPLPNTDVLNAAQLDDLVNALSAEALLDLFGRLQNDVAAFLDDIKDLNDPASRAVQAHNVAGSAAMLGAQRLGILLNQIETLCEHGRVKDVSDALPELRTCWENTQDGLKAWLSRLT